MRYSIEPRDRRYVKGYGFLSFAKNIGKYIGKNIRKRHGQKLVSSAKKSERDAIKTSSKKAIQKTAEATGDLVGDIIANKITSVSKKSHDEESPSKETNNEIPNKRYISPKEIQQIIDELRLV